MQAAARDPLQHILPLLYTRPDAAKSVIRYTLKEFQVRLVNAANRSDLATVPPTHLSRAIALQSPGDLFSGSPYFLVPWGIVDHGLLSELKRQAPAGEKTD